MVKRPYQKKAVLEELYYERGLSQTEIADKFDVAHQTISKYMVNHNINPGQESGHFERKERATYFIGSHGYPNVAAWNADEKVMEHVKVHRLLAVAKFGFHAVEDMDVHHLNECRFDNRPENIELLSPSEHMSLHSSNQDYVRDTDGTFKSQNKL